VVSFSNEERDLQSKPMNQMPTDDRPLDLSTGEPKYASNPLGASTAQPAKTHLLYWERAIFQRRPNGNWYALIQHKGERRKLSLETSNKTTAANRARDLYVAILAGGWEQALRLYRPERAVKTGEVTIGQFLAELKTKANLNPGTLESYAVAFRGLVADIFQIEGNKFDYRGGGRDLWIEKINAIRLDAITLERVQAWKRTFIARAGDDPRKQRSARISVNSYLRRAQCLFGPKAIKHCALTLPSPLPFAGIDFEKRQSSRYHSNIKPAKLAKAAQKELAEGDPPAYLAFLLALAAGLRRMEIDRLQWPAFDWDKKVIKIRRTRVFEPKTETAVRDVWIDPEVLTVFRNDYALRGTLDSFVIEGLNLSGPDKNYRAKAVFDRLSNWLREHGVTALKPLHELRKEFGSMVNRAHGLSAAKDLLGHADIGITAAYYIDKPHQVTSGLGSLLEKPKRKGKKIVPFQDKDGQPGVSEHQHGVTELLTGC
jgi:integrase